MRIRQLRFFATVAKYGNITQAAKSLNISQPPLSRELRSLESELGIRLYHAGRRGIELTSDGKRFLQQAKEVITRFDALADNFQSRKRQKKSAVLRLGTTIGPTVDFLPAVLPRFLNSHPNVKATVTEGISSDLELQLLKSELDLVLLTDPSHHDGLSYKTCGKVEMVPFVSTKHPLAKKKVLTPQELLDAPILLCRQVRGMASRMERILQGMANKKTELNIVMHPADHRMLRRTVRSGLGVGFTYGGLLTEGLRRGMYKILRVTGFKMVFDIELVTLRDRPLPKTATAFIGFVRRATIHSRDLVRA